MQDNTKARQGYSMDDLGKIEDKARMALSGEPGAYDTFLAALVPETILMMIAEIRRMRAELKPYRAPEEDLEALDQAAAAATPGPYEVVEESGGDEYYFRSEHYRIKQPGEDFPIAPISNEADARYFAALYPQRIQRILRELRSLRRQVPSWTVQDRQEAASEHDKLLSQLQARTGGKVQAERSQAQHATSIIDLVEEVGNWRDHIEYRVRAIQEQTMYYCLERLRQETTGIPDASYWFSLLRAAMVTHWQGIPILRNDHEGLLGALVQIIQSGVRRATLLEVASLICKHCADDPPPPVVWNKHWRSFVHPAAPPSELTQVCEASFIHECLNQMEMEA